MTGRWPSRWAQFRGVAGGMLVGGRDGGSRHLLRLEATWGTPPVTAAARVGVREPLVALAGVRAHISHLMKVLGLHPSPKGSLRKQLARKTTDNRSSNLVKEPFPPRAVILSAHRSRRERRTILSPQRTGRIHLLLCLVGPPSLLRVSELTSGQPVLLQQRKSPHQNLHSGRLTTGMPPPVLVLSKMRRYHQL